MAMNMVRDEVFEVVDDFVQLKLKAFQREDWDEVEALTRSPERMPRSPRSGALMVKIDLPQDIYETLEEKAANHNMTVETLAIHLLTKGLEDFPMAGENIEIPEELYDKLMAMSDLSGVSIENLATAAMVKMILDYKLKGE